VKVRSVHFWIASLSLAVVVGVAVVDLRRTSPGELTRVHAQTKKLESGSNCNACHGGLFSGMTESCLECHAPIEQQIKSSKGLHGTIGKSNAQKCATCHSEHHGGTFEIVNRQSFALAGVSDPTKFDHKLIGWDMNGAHAELACAECHENASLEVLPENGVRFLGLAQDCASCHEDPHKGQMKVSCASCHGQETWQKMHADGHEKHLPLIGGHGALDCRTCHAQGEEHALELMDKRVKSREPRTCIDCHATPHNESFVQQSAMATGIAFENSCVSCHAAEHDSFRDQRLVLTAEQHAWSGFKLDVPHDKQTCERCHDPHPDDFKQRYPGRGQNTCSACHADPHGGQFAQGPFSTGDCLACHERTRFEPHTFDLEKHTRADFALTGAHATTKCNECHLDPRPADSPREFRGIESKCEACHKDVHDGVFAAPATLLTPQKAGECSRCHDTLKFADVPEKRFDHGAWTSFAVEGAHAQSSCEVCHAPRPMRTENGRVFGKVEEKFGKYQGCVTCHQDPHAGIFDGPQFPRVVDGKQDCARCHDSTSFRTLWQGFDHGRWTGFELRQGHKTSECSACHTPLIPPDKNGRSWQPALGSSCADCHDNPHGEQFAVAGATDCARCHADEARDFSTFDHERGSRFPLGDTHKNVACAQCHESEVPLGLKNAVPIVRYKPLGIECADCHGVHDEVLLRHRPVIK
jgi:hypothetical protein